MPTNFREFFPQELASLLAAFPFQRRITNVHLHHTWRPNHSQFRGLTSIESMDRFHTEQGFGGLAQHLTLAPSGSLWTGRDWNRRPASARGFNGNNIAGPFMIEMVGDFDSGKDPFIDPQRSSAIETVATLLRFFGLPVSSLRFHNHMSSKTCPGSGLDYDGFCGEVEAAMSARRDLSSGTGGERGPFPESARLGAPNSSRISDLVDSLRATTGGARDLESDAEPPEELADRDTILMMRGEGVPSGARGGDRDLTSDELEELRPYAINLRQGRLSKGGIFNTSKGHVEAIFREHLVRAYDSKPQGDPLRIVLWAHGGLVSEAKGLGIAHLQHKWWLSNGCYPIHFIWESGLLETLLPFFGRGVTRDFFDFTSDFAIEQAVRVPGSGIWGLMKLSAEAASTAEDGGALLAARLLAEFCSSRPEVELYACGHSAGSIFHNHFLPACRASGVPNFEWVHYLAPAVRVNNFLEKLHPLVGDYVKRISIYTMHEALEKDDNVARVYRKSLLYLIRNALNLEFRSDILGLEECLLENDQLKATFGLAGHSSAAGDCVFSKTSSDSGRNASRSTTHGGFDNDRPTMHSIARRVLKMNDSDPLKADFPVQASRDLFAGMEFPMPAVPSVSTSMPQATAAVAAGCTVPSRGGSGGKTIALCVGIDTYPTAPLNGCVHDARLWASTFRDLGFDEVRMLVNSEATHARMTAELTRLVSEAQSGDCIVFQYAGHGTHVPDMEGDEEKGEDQAFVPVDYEAGRHLIDDEVRLIFSRKSPGVNLTCFIDCCHSGTITRMLGGGRPPFAPGENARFLKLTDTEKDRYREFRSTHPVSRAQPGFYAVSFSACQDHEVALENAGQGDFTRRAVPLLRSGFRKMSHADFQRQVVGAFGSAPRQNPKLDCDAAVTNNVLLACVAPSGQIKAVSSGGGVDVVDRIQAGLRQISLDLETLR
ncbi:MAG TPA: caspase family protein [Bryobacteraceae bacterium]|nr:caspase family protein [Bryobacteraceae bacterium]